MVNFLNTKKLGNHDFPFGIPMKNLPKRLNMISKLSVRIENFRCLCNFTMKMTIEANFHAINFLKT